MDEKGQTVTIIPVRPNRWRLTTSLSVTVAILFLAIVAFTFFAYRDLLAEREAAEVENTVAISRTIAAQIDGFVQDIEGTTLAVASALGNEPGLSHQRTGPYLKAVQSHFLTLRALFLTDLQGRVIASASGEGIGLDLSQRPYILRLQAGSLTTWSRGIKGIASGQTTVAFGRRVVDDRGQLRAFLVAAFYPPSLMARLRATLPTDANITLLDDAGNVLFSTHFPERSPVPDFGRYTAVQEALRGRPTRFAGDAAPFTTQQAFGAIVPVTRPTWAVAITRPLEPLRASLLDPVLTQILGIFGVMLLALAVYILIARWLIRPLGSLAATAASIARGDTPEIALPSGPVEVTQLAEGMAVMARAVDRRERQLKFINEASRQLAVSLDYEATLKHVARLAVPDIADWCVVDLVDEDGRLRRLSVAHVDPAKVAMAAELEKRYPTDPTAPQGAMQVIRTGKSDLYPEITDEMLVRAARDPEHLRVLREVGLRSVMVVPLVARGQTLGAMTFVTAESDRRYGHEDLELAEALASRTAVAIDNARMYAHERSIAETLQRSLLPERLPEIPGVRAAARYLPGAAEAIGGDWYDMFVLPGGKVGLVMGDVAGRGVPVASLMGQLRTSLRAYAVDGYPPADVVARLNDLIEPGHMATLVYLMLDPVTWTVTYSNAGHLPPLVAEADGTVRFLEGGTLPLGNTLAVHRHEGTAQLRPGSTVVLCTDGLVEERGISIDVGLARLRDVMAGVTDEDLEQVLERIVAAVPGQAALNDDVAILAVRVTAMDAAHVTLRLPAVPASLATLRQSIRRWLANSGAGDADTHEIVVACNEAASNVIEHAYGLAGGMVELSAGRQNGAVVIQIRDWGRWRSKRSSDGGRGLAMIRALMDEVEIKQGEDGTLLEMRRRLRT